MNYYRVCLSEVFKIYLISWVGFTLHVLLTTLSWKATTELNLGYLILSHRYDVDSHLYVIPNFYNFEVNCLTVTNDY